MANQLKVLSFSNTVLMDNIAIRTRSIPQEISARFGLDTHPNPDVAKTAELLLTEYENSLKKTHREHAVAFQEAITIILGGPNTLAATSPLTNHHVSILLNLVQLAVIYYQRNSETSEFATDHTIGIVVTPHPSRAINYSAYFDYGAILENLDAIMAGSPRAQERAKSSLRKLCRNLQNLSPILVKPTGKEEVERHQKFLENFMKAVYVLESKQDKIGKLPIELWSWAGFEADRNATTPQVILQTVVLNRVFMCEKYIHLFKALKDTNDSEVIHRKIDKIIKHLEAMSDKTKRSLSFIRMLAAIDILKYEHEDQSKWPKHIKDNYEEFFKGKSMVQIHQYHHGRGRSYQIDTTLPIHELREILEATLNTYLNDNDLTPEKLIESIQSMQSDIASSDSENSSSESSIFDSREHSCLPILKELESMAIHFGFYMVKGQGRLDAKSILGNAARRLLGLELSDDPTTRCQQIIDAILVAKPNNIALDNLSDAESKNTFDYFRYIQQLNRLNDQHVPVMVMANYETTEDFLNAFFLAIKAGLITIEDGQVTEATILFMPLLESVDDHDNGPNEFKKLFSIPIIRSYYEKMGQVTYMKAYSDTARNDGLPASDARLRTSATPIYDVFNRAFGVVEPSEDPHGLFSNNPDTQAAWTAVYEHAPQQAPTLQFRVEHGRGSSQHRSGGSFTDQLTRASLPIFERKNALETLQPGRLEQDLWNLSASERLLKSYLYNYRLDTKAAEFASAITPEYIAFMNEFTQPGKQAANATFTTKGNDFNNWLEDTLLAPFVLNDMPLSSRAKAPQNIKKSAKAFVDENRMITVTAFFEQLGFSFHTVLPLFEDLEAALGPQRSMNTKKLGELQALYLTNPHFNLYIKKMSECLHRSSLERLSRHMPQESDLYRDIETKYNACVVYINAITQRSSLLLDEPEILANLEIEAKMRDILSDQMVQHLHQYDPRQTGARPVYAENSEKWWKVLPGDLAENSRVSLTTLATAGNWFLYA